jgi:hypothetical protein
MLLATSALAALPMTAAHAGDATWNPGSADFNIGTNWTGTPDKKVPDGTATFNANASIKQAIIFNQTTTLGGMTLTQGAGDYTFGTNAQDITFTGAGLSVGSSASLTLNNNGGSNTTFSGNSTAGQALININDGTVTFTDHSKAGSSILNVNTADPANNILPTLTFAATSSADQATITNNAFVNFNDNSTAGQAKIDNKGNLNFGSNSGDTASAGAATITNELSATLNFHDSTSAETATITNSSAFFKFFDKSTAANATIINHGAVSFQDSSTAGNAFIQSDGIIFIGLQASGGTARIQLGNTGSLDISLSPRRGRRSVRSKATARSSSAVKTSRSVATMGRPSSRASFRMAATAAAKAVR